MDWLQQTATGKRDALRLTPHDDDREPSQDANANTSQDGGKENNDDAGTDDRQELDGFGDEIPLTWAEVRGLYSNSTGLWNFISDCEPRALEASVIEVLGASFAAAIFLLVHCSQM